MREPQAAPSPLRHASTIFHEYAIKVVLSKSCVARRDVPQIWVLNSIDEYVEHVVSQANYASFPNATRAISIPSHLQSIAAWTKQKSLHVVSALVFVNHLETQFAVESSFPPVLV